MNMVVKGQCIVPHAIQVV